MTPATRDSASILGERLDHLLNWVVIQTDELVKTGDLPEVISHFVELRDITSDLRDKLTLIQKHVDTLSQELIPTLFLNNGKMTSMRLKGIGTVKVSERWSASIHPGSKVTAINWLKNSNMEGIVQETVNAQTLGAIAKDAQIAGKPLPSDLFKVSSSSYTSVTK